jgi:hypothetical protein
MNAKTTTMELISKKKSKDARFYVRVPQCSVFRTFCESIFQIVAEGYFTVTNTPDFKGFKVACMDMARSCVVQGQLSAAVESSEEKITFCVRMVNLIQILKSATFSHFVDIWIEQGSEDLCVRIFEPDITSFTPSFKVKTLQKENDFEPLCDLLYTFVIELELKTFVQNIKIAKDQKAEIVSFKIHKGTAGVAYFVIGYQSLETTGSFVFPSQTHTVENGNIVLKTTEVTCEHTEDLDTLEIVYAGTFSCEYLNMISKSVDRHFVHIRLGTETPLSIEYAISGASNEQDYLRFVLAEKEI